ncbi:GNAT family N-acetyltransferase [Saccharothrix longispora]|uniref:bifunctional acetate--CoA ligase family protein/GNAT family N-acetyltransferase n=1 Tax=Saccharothrix longispora TaxID=33920 RepID=UPI0028FD3027|nr:GNAT family N-acetyltransferase [Saccharothrix longispora]MBY8850110.1 bifunctional GNAT family N-acetyltransferase/acetate--CoA ligase family protein [Saccharothrix sp. MB29]MDU0293481.1 GNAT family N-acetyltransferase [Saccharothrix longispora]
MTAPPVDRALLADGSVVALRELGPADADALLALHRGLPPDDRYLRFFGASPRLLDDFVARLTSPDEPGHVVLGAFAAGVLVGAASYALLGGDTAEVALVVAHDRQSHGVGTLMLEHLVSLARARGVRRFRADVLTANAKMLRVFADLGLTWTSTAECGEVRVDLGLDPGERYLEAVADRELAADVASLRAVLAPSSVVVVGAGRKRSSVGNAVLYNLVFGGYPGTLYAVNPHTDQVLGVASHRSVADLPQAPDLAVVCVPADAVPQVAEDCGRRGVKALVVITSGVDRDLLLDVVRRHGMRLVGPNCVGVSGTDPDVRMNATFMAGRLTAGDIGVVTQSGGVAIAVVERLRALGLGTTELVSTGDKYDVSGNDLLLWWERDERTRAVVLYLESFGNPRKFSRLARRVAARKPVLAVRAASSEAGQRAAASHTASTATPAVTRDALFRQAGVTAVDGVAELVEVLAALHATPLPAGRRVAVLSNAGGLGVLAADACARHGLTVADLGVDTVDAVRALLPGTASAHNPVDTTAAVDERTFGHCLDLVAADPAVDAVIAVTVPTAVADPAGGVHRTAKTVLAVSGDQDASVSLTADGIAVYADPARAATVLAALAERGEWLRRPAPELPEPSGTDLAEARAVVAGQEGWLSPDRVVRLLKAFGLPVLGGALVRDAESAVAAQRSFDAPVALKAVADDLLHKSEGGGVLLDLAGEDAVTRGFEALRDRFGDRLTGVFVQPMARRGRELLVGVVTDPQFGPLVVTGLGGVDTDLLDDRAAALAPLSEADLDDLLHGFRAAPKVFRDHDEAVVRDVLRRVSRLAELLPEVAELDLNPLVLTEDDVIAVDARVRVAPAEPVDPFLRRLRDPRRTP